MDFVTAVCVRRGAVARIGLCRHCKLNQLGRVWMKIPARLKCVANSRELRYVFYSLGLHLSLPALSTVKAFILHVN